jgi:hypothetical protein
VVSPGGEMPRQGFQVWQNVISFEPTDCESIWRYGHYRGTDPDPNIRLQLMHRR